MERDVFDQILSDHYENFNLKEVLLDTLRRLILWRLIFARHLFTAIRLYCVNFCIFCGWQSFDHYTWMYFHGYQTY